MEDIKTRPVTSCINCGASGSICQEQVFDPDGIIARSWTLRKCDNHNCGLVWLDPAPLENELWKAYTQYHTHTKKRESKMGKMLLGLVNRLIRLLLLPLWVVNGLQREMRQMRLLMLGGLACGKLLDVGCGGGRYLYRMQRRGWQVEGVDFDEQATRRASESYGIKAYTGDLRAAKLPADNYDAITMSHTIEHLVDPEAILRECFRVLKPGGRLVLVTPNVESSAAKLFGAFWRGWEPPRHLQLFSPNSLRQLTSRAGFVVEDVRTSAAASAIGYRVSATNQSKAAGKKNTLLLQLKLLPWSYFKELVDYYAQKRGGSAAQNLLVIATKSRV